MKVNIVMLAHDRPRLTSQAMRSLGENTPAELYNLTVIDDASQNRVLSLDDNTAVLRIENSKGITGQARNLGVYWAEKYWGRGDYLYLTDNDVYFCPSWLETLIDVIEDPRLHPVGKIVGGWNHPFQGPNNTLYWPDKRLKITTHNAVAGASQLMRWDVWDQFGPLDAHAKGVGQSEDWKMCQDIIHAGGVVASAHPRVVFNCGVTNSFGEASPGADVMIRELQQAKMTYPGLYWE